MGQIAAPRSDQVAQRGSPHVCLALSTTIVRYRFHLLSCLELGVDTTAPLEICFLCNANFSRARWLASASARPALDDGLVVTVLQNPRTWHCTGARIRVPKLSHVVGMDVGRLLQNVVYRPKKGPVRIPPCPPTSRFQKPQRRPETSIISCASRRASCSATVWYNPRTKRGPQASVCGGISGAQKINLSRPCSIVSGNKRVRTSRDLGDRRSGLVQIASGAETGAARCKKFGEVVRIGTTDGRRHR